MMQAAVPSPEHILDALPNPVLLVAKDNSVARANSAAEDFFQASANQLAKLQLPDLLPFASPVLQCVQQIRTTGGVVNEYAVSVGTPRFGGERSVDVQSSAMADDPNFVLLMVMRRSMAHKLDLQLSHQGSARSVSGMASMLAHEIKNPLSGIRGAAQLLEPALADGDRMLARLICDETDRIRDLVDQMEVFSDERPLSRQPVNIHIVLDRVKQLVKAGDTSAPAIVEEYDPSLPAVHGNHDQLVQVFLNLARNAVEAIDASGEPGTLTFRTAFRPGIRLAIPGSTDKVSLPFEVCVDDTGPGVPVEMRPHVFDAFVSSKRSGRGLGLALVAKIIRDHGGVVECLARDRGTTFRILLPLMKGQDAAPQSLEAVAQ